MKTRILSAVVALPLLLFIVISGGIWLHVGVGLLGLIGMYEFNRAIAGEVKGAHIIAYLFGLFYVVFMDKLVYTQTLFSVFTSLFVLALLIYSVLCYRKTSYVECCASFFGFFYACFLLSHVYLVRDRHEKAGSRHRKSQRRMHSIPHSLFFCSKARCKSAEQAQTKR